MPSSRCAGSIGTKFCCIYPRAFPTRHAPGFPRGLLCTALCATRGGGCLFLGSAQLSVLWVALSTLCAPLVCLACLRSRVLGLLCCALWSPLCASGPRCGASVVPLGAAVGCCEGGLALSLLAVLSLTTGLPLVHSWAALGIAWYSWHALGCAVVLWVVTRLSRHSLCALLHRSVPLVPLAALAGSLFPASLAALYLTSGSFDRFYLIMHL